MFEVVEKIFCNLRIHIGSDTLEIRSEE